MLSSPAEAWINRYRKQLVRSISPQFLEEIICYLRRLDLLTAEEAGRAQEASSLPEQVRAVVDVLAGKGSYASQSLQTFIETTNSQLYLHITVYGRQSALDPIRGVCTHVLGVGTCWSTPRCAQSWAALAALMGVSMQVTVPSQGLRWGRTQPAGDKGSLPGLRHLPPGPLLPSAHLSGQPEESLMSSTSRSHQSLPAAGLGTGGWQEEDSWVSLAPSVGGCPNFRLSLQPFCQERLPWFPSWLPSRIASTSNLGWCLLCISHSTIPCLSSFCWRV